MKHFLVLLAMGLASSFFTGSIWAAGSLHVGMIYSIIGFPAILVTSIAGAFYCEKLTRKV
jgi:hypothetical protein